MRKSASVSSRVRNPICARAGYSDSLSEEIAHQIGIRHLLVKPVPAKLLLERVAACLKQTV